MADYEGTDAIYVVDYNDDTGLPVLGHAVLCFQDSSGCWYYTEYTGTNKKNAKVYLKTLGDSAKERLFGNISTKALARSGTKYIYLTGDYSDCYDAAKKYAKNGFGKYNFLTNNCLHYVQKVLQSGNVSKTLKAIFKTPFTAPNAFGNALGLYCVAQYAAKIIKSFRIGKYKLTVNIPLWK